MSFDPAFLLTNVVEIGSALRELTRSTERLMIQAEPDPIGVLVSEVNVRARTFRFQPFSNTDLQRLAAREHASFAGSAFGAQIAFEAQDVRLVNDDALDAPVLEAPFPAQLYRMQRRQHFRATARPNSTATWRTTSGGALTLRIFDVSLGGVGLRCRIDMSELPPAGTMLKDTHMDFLDLGALTADLRIVGLHEVIEHDFSRGNMRYTHMGCSYVQEDKLRERFLERLVRQLEMRLLD